jgi:arabinose-5-phosphate isomerase
MIEKIKNLIIEEMAAIANIPVNNSYEEAINLIYKKVHLSGGKLITSGMGKAGQIALNIATTFSSTGTCAVYLHPSEAQHGDLGILRENDVLLLLSNSGKTREIVELITLAGNLHPGIEIICITGNPESELAKGSDVILLTGGSPEICPLGLTPTTSTTLMTIIGDMLVVTLMEKIGFTKEEYSKRHHSGYLGSKSRGEE